jgi:hypothetical protein
LPFLILKSQVQFHIPSFRYGEHREGANRRELLKLSVTPPKAERVGRYATEFQRQANPLCSTLL